MVSMNDSLFLLSRIHITLVRTSHFDQYDARHFTRSAGGIPKSKWPWFWKIKVKRVMWFKKKSLLLSQLKVKRRHDETHRSPHKDHLTALFNWDGKIFFDGERYGDMIGDVLKTCLECIAVAIKFLDGKIFNYVKKLFFKLNLHKICSC